MRNAVDVLVLSRLRYYISVYGYGTAKNEAKLPSVVNFATRVIAGLRKHDHVFHARRDLRLPLTQEVCYVATTNVARRAIACGEPCDIASLFVT